MRSILHLLFAIALGSWAGSAAAQQPIVVAINDDVHFDYNAEANDFHIEGSIRCASTGPPVVTDRLVFGDPGTGNWSVAGMTLTPLGGEDWWFTIDFVTDGYITFCQWIHFGIEFEVFAYNVIADLRGWWTLDGQPVGGPMPITGFWADDLGEIRPGDQTLRIMNDTEIPIVVGALQIAISEQRIPLPDLFIHGLGRPGEPSPSYPDLEWIDAPDLPGEIPPDSFFDVFLEIPGIEIPPGAFLLVRGQQWQPEFYGDWGYFWEQHGANPAEDEWDFGDAPDRPYPTLLANDGARHRFEQNVFLGAQWDGEPDGQPHPNALGDDLANLDDEDGVTFVTPLIPGQSATVSVFANIPGRLDAWIDFDANGDWASATDQIFAAEPLNAGPNMLSFLVPAGSPIGVCTFARFRFSMQGGLYFRGPADNGEVEDYEVCIDPPQEELDFGDAPDPSYPTLLANDGARHRYEQGVYLGNLWDAEPDGLPSPDALGDDNDNLDDEDGVNFMTPLNPGQPATIDVIASQDGYLDAWIDFNGNGDWSDSEDHIYAAELLIVGSNSLTFTVPASAGPNLTTYARFRFSMQGGLDFRGAIDNGEVEDYRVRIEEGQAFKWEQPPDLDRTGIDVFTTHPYLLADDFACEETGLITKVGIWGSWFNDYVPFGQWPEGVGFTLSFHTDIPAEQSSTGYSMPGLVLWYRHYAAGDFAAVPWAEGPEGWLVPPDMYTFPADSICWYYEFEINPDEAFLQLGAPGAPVVYWLDVQAYPEDPEARFGWKTSHVQWNDAAVWGMGNEPYVGPWEDLKYPPGHEWMGERLDLAFRLAGEPQEVELDFGDAPVSYRTLLAHNGARHLIDYRVYLGELIDAEPDGLPSPDALGDDNDNLDDEDGVIFMTPLTPGSDADVEVSASVWGYLDAWIDFDASGTWEPDEQIFNLEPVGAGPNFLIFPVPPTGGVEGFDTMSRWRFRTAPFFLTPEGPAYDGEVEDYMVYIEFDPADAPEKPMPMRFGLHPNVPNPFKPFTTIRYDLPAGGGVIQLAIYDVEGHLVRTLVAGHQNAGEQSVQWRGRDEAGLPVSPGIYYYRLKAEGFEMSRKMILLK